jgi:RimJ/RimL family protein N-acetyltransferase
VVDEREAGAVRIEAWGDGDLALLEQLLGDPAMMEHLGGPERPEKIADRQRRYAQPGSRQFRIVWSATNEAVGWVGYWERAWHGDMVFEIGWSVLPEFQGRGVATLATRLAVERARSERRLRFMLAYPAVENGPSNAVCRKVGFALIGQSEYEYPPGNLLQCHDWRLDLFDDQ